MVSWFGCRIPFGQWPLGHHAAKTSLVCERCHTKGVRVFDKVIFPFSIP